MPGIFLAKKRDLMIVMMAIALIACFVSGCGSSTGAPAGITRLDDEGYLYYMDYTKDYYGKDVMDAMRKVGFIDSGCSTFFTHNTDGAPITCRNYDYPHRVSKEDRSLTGLNVVLHCKPEGKYESIAVADAVWCDEENPMFQKGGPDLEEFDISMMDILPYECMDGINDQSAVQNPHTNASGISMTQYSAIYNNEKKTVEVWPFQNYSKSFVFDVTGNQVPAGK